ncbi:MAG: acetyl-CoA carboxylase biotin carboxyl carrier protein subunit, partial [Steroidobacteraceae bacterium]
APGGAAVTASPWATRDGFTPNLPALVGYTLCWGGRSHGVEIGSAAGEPVSALLGGRTPVRIANLACPAAGGMRTIAATIDERRREAHYFAAGERLSLWEEDAQYDFLLEDPRTREFATSAGSAGLTTPLPGVVVSVAVAVGQQVAAGEVLMVIEAMKMEHTVLAPYAGTVQTLHFARGERVPEGSQLLELTRA